MTGEDWFLERRRGSRPWLLIAAAVALAVILLGFAGVRYAHYRAIRELISPEPRGGTTPASVKVPFARLSIPSGDRHLEAWWVRADTAPSPAVLVFHGNHTTLSDQVGLQQVLYDNGISSLVFDYSGFGSSTGSATPEHLREDAVAAFRVFADSAGARGRRVAMGTSLGGAVLLSAVTEIEPGIDGIILVGVFSSAREVAIRSGRVPQPLGFLVPDLYDNVLAAARIHKPLLVVHSDSDEVFPIGDAERIVAAAAGPARLVRQTGVPHAEYLAANQDWQPVIAFIRGGADQR